MKKLSILFISFLSLNSLASNKAIYGSFDIRNIEEIQMYHVKKQASSVALMVAKHALREEVKDSLYSIRSNKLTSKFPLCEDDIKKDELSLGSCSAFLVDNNKVLTAGHCLLHADWDCTQKAFVFDVKKDFFTQTSAQYFVKSQVYSCKKILKHVNDPETGIDYSLIEVDRDVVKRVPLKLSQNDLGVNDLLYMIGHPIGTASKYSFGAYVREDKENFYVANMDSFVGNSGSAVFSLEDQSLIGLLARGEEDFIWDKENQCNKLVRCEDDACRGEDIIKSSVILSEISEFLSN